MNFSPHHSFSACGRLEKRIDVLRAAGAIPQVVFDAHEKYHSSLLHKLRSARYHTETLSQYLRTINAPQLDPADIVYRVNFHFDGFLHVLGSATDIFAHEILSYFGVPLPDRVYHYTASKELTTRRPGDPIIALLADPTWRTEFSDYRNTATHERLIAAGYTLHVETKGRSSVSRIVFPIPDDPRAAVATATRNKDITEYCERTFKRVISHFNQIYSHIEERAKVSGALPL